MTTKELIEHLKTAQANENTSLDLSSRGIVELPKEIGMLKNLVSLDLSDNNLTRLPNELGNLLNLKDLNIKDNELFSLPAAFGDLKSLQQLHMNENRFTSFPEQVFSLSNLRHICIASNAISEIGDGIANLTKLEDIQLFNNAFASFPLSLTKVDSLKKIGIGRNKIQELPIEITGLNNLTEISLAFNPLSIPPEVISKGVRTLFKHIQKHEEAKNKKFFSEAKLVFVGDGNVGKTSLIRMLQGEKFNNRQSKTDGIAINKWNLKVDQGREVSVNIWDFGGQEIMHATHQFFLTERSVYVLVLNTREEDRYGMVEYWLKLIRSFGGSSPIIIALNKCDEHMGDVDRKGLQSKYNIHGFATTSCRDGKGKKELIEQIKEAIGNLEHTKFEWLDNEFRVKRQLEAMKYDYISYEDYHQICLAEGVQDDKDLISFLHDLGTVLNFKDDRRLSDTNILNPSWVTEGVYKIINSKTLFETKGLLDIDKVSYILNSKAYPKNKHLFIIDMMKHFELCFDIEGTKGQKLLIPELLPIQEPDFEWDYEDNLSFQYKYDFLTSSIISRFIVKIHSFIENNTYWKNGVLIKTATNRCLIKADREERIIFIYVSGGKYTRRDALSMIRFQFDLIHSTISSSQPIELIPVPGTKKETVKYRHVLQLEKLHQGTYITEEGKQVLINDLLAGIDTTNDKQKLFHDDTAQLTITNSFNTGGATNHVTTTSKEEKPIIPWYKTTWAYITGALAFAAALLGIADSFYSVSEKMANQSQKTKASLSSDSIGNKSIREKDSLESKKNPKINNTTKRP